MDILSITYFLNSLLMIAMPLALAMILTRRWKVSWRFWFVGAAVFVLSQVGHIPFLFGLTALFQKDILPNPPAAWKDPFNAITLGLLAGLFEELSRYAMFRWWLKDARSWRAGVLAGAGHGGAEAILLGVLALLAYIQLSAFRNPAALAAIPAEQLEAARTQIAAYWSAPWYATLLGALERLLTIPVQISLSLIVMQTFTRRKWFWVWLAVLFHTVIDASAVFLAPRVGVYWLEAIVAGFSLLSLLIIFKLRDTGGPSADQPLPGTAQDNPKTPTRDMLPVEENPENLEGSKYQ